MLILKQKQKYCFIACKKQVLPNTTLRVNLIVLRMIKHGLKVKLIVVQESLENQFI